VKEVEGEGGKKGGRGRGRKERRRGRKEREGQKRTDFFPNNRDVFSLVRHFYNAV